MRVLVRVCMRERERILNEGNYLKPVVRVASELLKNKLHKPLDTPIKKAPGVSSST